MVPYKKTSVFKINQLLIQSIGLINIFSESNGQKVKLTSTESNRNVWLRNEHDSAVESIAPRLVFQLDNKYVSFLPKIVFTSHTLTALMVLVAALYHFSTLKSEALEPEERFIENSVRGFKALFVAIIAYGTLFFPNNMFKRPFPAFWTLIQAISLCYAIILVFILFLSKDDLMYFLNKYVDSDLGIPLEEKVHFMNSNSSIENFK